MSNIDKTKLTNEAVSANIKVENALTYINIQCVIDRSYQRTYANDKNLVTSLTNGVMESGFKVFAQGLQNGISLGEVGLKKFNETEYTLPGGQHRRIFLQLFALQVLKRLRKFKNEIKEYEILKSILFMSGDLEDRSDSFKTRLVNEKTVDKTDFENAIKVIGDFVSSKSMLLSEDLPKTEICKNQYLETFEQIGQIIADKEEDLDLNQSLNQKDFALFLYGSLKNTWLIVTYLGENDSEAEYYRNTFNPNRVESEADRVRVVSQVFCPKEDKVELMELNEKCILLAEKLYAKGSVLKESSGLMKVALMNVGEVNEVVTMNTSYSNSISNILIDNYKKGLSPVVFYKEYLKILNFKKLLGSKSDSALHKKLRLLSLFINNIGNARHRHAPIFFYIIEKLINDNNFASIKDIYNYVLVMISYIINRSVTIGINTEKGADLFFFKIFKAIKALNLNNLNDITKYIEREMINAELISTKKKFFNMLCDKEFTKNNVTLFAIIKSLCAVNYCHLGSEFLEDHIIETSEYMFHSDSKKQKQVEHFISQEPEKVFSEMKNGVEKKILIASFNKYVNSPANLFILSKNMNGYLSNDNLETKQKVLYRNQSLVKDLSLLNLTISLEKNNATFLSDIKSPSKFSNFFEEFFIKPMNEVLEAGMVFAD